ncbi:hypothetical protein ABIB25_000199 [Nakamurella sp. UYEF19]
MISVSDTLTMNVHVDVGDGPTIAMAHGAGAV